MIVITCDEVGVALQVVVMTVITCDEVGVDCATGGEVEFQSESGLHGTDDSSSHPGPRRRC